VRLPALALLSLAPLVPGAPAPPAPPATSGEVDWHAFELFREGYLYAPGTANGVAVDMVLDTGAGITVVSSAFADVLELEEGLEIQAQGVGGNQKARLVSGVRMALAGVELKPMTVAVVDLVSVERHIGRDMRVILGRELFAEWVVDVDYPGRRFALLASADYEYEGPGRTVDLFRRDRGWSVEARVEGLETARFALDTGSGGTLSLFEAYTDQHDLLAERAPLSDVSSGGVGGRMKMITGSLRAFEFGGYELGSMPVSFHRGDEGAFGSIRAAGNLGTSVLRRFHVVFDAPHAKLHLEPGPAFEQQDFRRNRSGLQVIHLGDALEVSHVAAGSPAETAGWSVGERIVAIDGRAVDAEYYLGAWLWSAADAGREVVLRDDGGRERTLVLATYY
jgi:hypothetical protein